MTPGDLAAVTAIERQSFQRPWSVRSFERELVSAWAIAEVAEDGGPDGPALVGYTCSWQVADELHLLNVAVHPARRRGGIGRRLLERVIAAARRVGARSVLLEVRSGNVGARALYAGLGFQQVGLRRGYYGPGQDAIIMKRTLEAAGR